MVGPNFHMSARTDFEVVGNFRSQIFRGVSFHLDLIFPMFYFYHGLFSPGRTGHPLYCQCAELLTFGSFENIRCCLLGTFIPRGQIFRCLNRSVDSSHSRVFPQCLSDVSPQQPRITVTQGVMSNWGRRVWPRSCLFQLQWVTIFANIGPLLARSNWQF